MNKKLVAVAIAGLLAAPLAQAQTANVTLYGRLSVQAEMINFDGPSGDSTVGQINSISSRWGLRGSEALGGGMNAIFQCETPLAADEGAAGSAVMCGREGWVGLNGRWGELKLGYGLTPYDDVKGFTDHQGSNSFENPNNGVSSGPGFAKNGLFVNAGNGQGTTNSGAFDARYGNSISYKTPAFSGFTMRTQYAFIDESPAQEAFGWDTALIYTNGPWTGGLTYAYHGDWAGIGGTAQAINNQQAWRIAGKWNNGKWQFDAYYDAAKYRFEGANVPAYVGVDQTYKYKNWAVGGMYFMGPWTFGMQYNARDKGLGTAYNGTTNSYNVSFANLRYWNEGGGDHYAATADYSLSKRTTLRMYGAWMQNEGTLVGGSNTSFGTLQGDSSVWALSGGIWHTF